MLGTNEVARSRSIAEGFNVHSIFYTLQGEGPLVGTPSIFVRLAGCNLRCFWCDTAFEGGEEMSADELMLRIRNLSIERNCHLVIITGGEPMLQPLRSLIDHPSAQSMRFQIETAGTVWPDDGLTSRVEPNERSSRLTIVCSPKTPSIVVQLQTPRSYDVYWKYIIRAHEEVSPSDGLPMMSTQIQGKKAPLFRPALEYRNRVFVQACDELDDPATMVNQGFAAALALKHSYRLSIQTHKLLGLD